MTVLVCLLYIFRQTNTLLLHFDTVQGKCGITKGEEMHIERVKEAPCVS